MIDGNMEALRIDELRVEQLELQYEYNLSIFNSYTEYLVEEIKEKIEELKHIAIELEISDNDLKDTISECL